MKKKKKKLQKAKKKPKQTKYKTNLLQKTLKRSKKNKNMKVICFNFKASFLKSAALIINANIPCLVFGKAWYSFLVPLKVTVT